MAKKEKPKKVDAEVVNPKMPYEVRKYLKQLKEESHTGRPRKFTPEQIKQSIEEYFEQSYTMGEKLTLTGLVMTCGFYSIHQLREYEGYAEFSTILRSARTIIEQGYEKNLHGHAVTGSIFALKQFGWIDEITSGAKDNNETPEDLLAEIKQLMGQGDLLEGDLDD